MAQASQNGKDTNPWWSLFEMSTAHAAEILEQTDWAIVPVGSIEQHGPHLPLGTDAMGPIALAKRIATKIPVVVAPPVVYGYSPYHMSWAGTITLRSQTMHALLLDIGTSLARHGVKVVVYLNGHGGNKPVIDVAASDLQFEADVRSFVVNYPYLGQAILDPRYDLNHAGRFETSAVIAYDPALVDLPRAVDPSDPDTMVAQARYRGTGAYPMRRDFREIQPTGWGGDPHSATLADADEMMETIANEVVRILAGEFGSPAPATPLVQA
jgi:creatinine amidohydrolase